MNKHEAEQEARSRTTKASARDAVVIEHGKLAIANPQYTLDLPEAIRSVRRLLDYEIEQIVCYHGGLLVSG